MSDMTDPHSLVREIAVFLHRTSWKLAVAESVTGGRLQAAITSLAGASEFFVGGMTTYDLARKVRLLGIDPEEAARCDCVSEQIAMQMARGVATCFQADVTIATTGYAQPAPEKHVATPFAYVGLRVANPRLTRGELLVVERCEGVGDRIANQEQFVKQALGLLVRELRRTFPEVP